MRLNNIISLFFLFSCSNDKDISNFNLNYLALGDSYTIGQSVDFNKNYPSQLKNKLNKTSSIKIDSVIVIAKTGWTTSQLIDTLSKLNLSTNYDLVSLLIGVNNQFRGNDILDYRNDFENLLIRSIYYSKNKKNVFVLSIPDYGVTPFGKKINQQKIFEEINNYNQINREISEKYEIMYFDITDISRMAESDSSLLAYDQLHPSNKMYEMWVDKIKYRLIDSILNIN